MILSFWYSNITNSLFWFPVLDLNALQSLSVMHVEVISFRWLYARDRNTNIIHVIFRHQLTPSFQFEILQYFSWGFWELSRRTEDFNEVQNRSGILRKISWRRYRCESRDILSWKEKKVFSCLLLMMTIPVIKFRSIGLVGYVWFVNLQF